MKRRIIPYSPDELAWIKSHCTMAREKAHAKFCKKFSREDVSLSNYVGLCKRNGWLTGRDGRLQPGAVSWNKGKKMPFNPDSAKTQFKKGQLPPNMKFAGHEYICPKDGYVRISINETNPHTGFERRYVLKHKHLWEQKNGKLPAGMCLKCLDGNRSNTDPDNWEAIPRGALPFLNGHRGHNYEAMPTELKPTVLALAKLKHAKHARVKRKHKSSAGVSV
jgi:hypothetical protein